VTVRPECPLDGPALRPEGQTPRGRAAGGKAGGGRSRIAQSSMPNAGARRDPFADFYIGAFNGVKVTLEGLRNGSSCANRSDLVSLGRYTMRGGRFPGHPCDALSNPATHAVSQGFRRPAVSSNAATPRKVLWLTGASGEPPATATHRRGLTRIVYSEPGQRQASYSRPSCSVVGLSPRWERIAATFPPRTTATSA
jgi:hypothetical protein